MRIWLTLRFNDGSKIGAWNLWKLLSFTNKEDSRCDRSKLFYFYSL
jgi:hypothetical protein